MRAPIVGLLAIVMALATVLLGWWAVPLVAALVAALAHTARGRAVCRPRGRCAGGAALAALLGWGGLLLVDGVVGARFGAVAGTLAAVLQAPVFAVVLATLLLPALLAWGAAGTVEGVLPRVLPRRATPPRRDDGGERRRPGAPTPPPAAPTRPAPVPDEPELVGAP